MAYENSYSGLNDLLKKNESIVLPYMFHKMLAQLLFYARFFELSVKNYEPYFFASYMIQTATMFHSIWSTGITEKELKFIQDDNKQNSNINILIAKCVGILIKSCLKNTFGIKEKWRECRFTYLKNIDNYFYNLIFDCIYVYYSFYKYSIVFAK